MDGFSWIELFKAIAICTVIGVWFIGMMFLEIFILTWFTDSGTRKHQKETEKFWRENPNGVPSKQKINYTTSMFNPFICAKCWKEISHKESPITKMNDEWHKVYKLMQTQNSNN